MIKVYTITATSTGGAGTSSGNATSELIINGFLVALSIDYTSEPNTTDVTITQVDPALALLTVSNANTNTTLAPRLMCVNTSNSAITDSNGYIPLSGYLKVAIAQGNNNGTVAVTFYVWSDRP